MRIVITGVPGTGKTEVAQILSKKLGYPLITTKDLVREEYVDVRKLRMKALWRIKDMKDVILEGHLFCEVKLPIDIVIVLRTNPQELVKRLSIRGYPERKLKENLMAEFLDYCLTRAESKYENVWQVDTTGKTANETVERIIHALKEGRKIYDTVDWSEVLEDWIRKGFIE